MATVADKARQRVKAYLVGGLYIGARDADEAGEGYRTFTGEEKFPEPEEVSRVTQIWPEAVYGWLKVGRKDRSTLADLIAEALEAGNAPPIWLASRGEI